MVVGGWGVGGRELEVADGGCRWRIADGASASSVVAAVVVAAAGSGRKPKASAGSRAESTTHTRTAIPLHQSMHPSFTYSIQMLHLKLACRASSKLGPAIGPVAA